jgi:hypothetical protein
MHIKMTKLSFGQENSDVADSADDAVVNAAATDESNMLLS